jgi:transcriptional regulator with GAF, ATPase, and Fis domain
VDSDFNRRVVDAVRELGARPTVSTTLESTVDLAVRSVDHCDMAGVSVVDGTRIRTLAASNEQLRQIDQLQFEVQEGPCYDALRLRDVVSASNLARDARWPRYGPRLARATGVRSSLSFRLFTTDRSLGALNLYAQRTDAFDHDDVLEGHVVSAVAAVVVAASLKESQLERALETRTVIGQATGILMERFGLGADQAFAVMQRVSQNHNIKLHRLATELVRTGRLPLGNDVALDGDVAGHPPATETDG